MPDPGLRKIPCTQWRTLPHFTVVHLMKNNVFIASVCTTQTAFLLYFKSIWNLRAVIHYAYAQKESAEENLCSSLKACFLLLVLHLTVELANDFLIKKQWEDAFLYNADQDPGKLHDVKKHSLLYHLMYTMIIVFQSFQRPTTTWNPHWKNKTKQHKTKTKPQSNKKPPHKTKNQQTYLKNPLPYEHLFSVGELQLQACSKATDSRFRKSRK